MATVELILGDCLPRLGEFSDSIIDVVVTDIPYGIGETGKKNSRRGSLAAPLDYGDYTWDIKVDPLYISEMIRVSQNQVVFGGNYYANLLLPSASWIVWDKLNTGDFADCEMAWTSHKRSARMFRYLWNGMIKAKPEKRYHPTQKPLELMTWVVENYTKDGDIILDPFMGSGTTGVACAKLGRSFISIEKDPKYFDIAKRRIEEAQSQLLLPI